MQYIAVFDFDGTITTKDTLWLFLKFSQRKARLYGGLLSLTPIFLLYFLKIIPNYKAKEMLFTHFFRGWNLQKFNSVCRHFSAGIEHILNAETIKILNEHKNKGHQIFIVSASVINWILPWAENYKIEVLATQVEVDASLRLTGKFKSRNCYGIEKVNRLLEVLPNDRKLVYIYAYGDSKGDKEMIDFADEGIYI